MDSRSNSNHVLAREVGHRVPSLGIYWVHFYTFQTSQVVACWSPNHTCFHALLAFEAQLAHVSHVSFAGFLHDVAYSIGVHNVSIHTVCAQFAGFFLHSFYNVSTPFPKFPHVPHSFCVSSTKLAQSFHHGSTTFPRMLFRKVSA